MSEPVENEETTSGEIDGGTLDENVDSEGNKPGRPFFAYDSISQTISDLNPFSTRVQGALKQQGWGFTASKSTNSTWLKIEIYKGVSVGLVIYTNPNNVRGLWTRTISVASSTAIAVNERNALVKLLNGFK